MNSPTRRTSSSSSTGVNSDVPGGDQIATDAQSSATHVHWCRNDESTNTRHHTRNCAARLDSSANAQLQSGSWKNAVAIVSVIASASVGWARRVITDRWLAIEHCARDHFLEGPIVPPRDLLLFGPPEVELHVVL